MSKKRGQPGLSTTASGVSPHVSSIDLSYVKLSQELDAVTVSSSSSSSSPQGTLLLPAAPQARPQSSDIHLLHFRQNHFCFYNDETQRLVFVKSFEEDVVLSVLSLKNWHRIHNLNQSVKITKTSAVITRAKHERVSEVPILCAHMPFRAGWPTIVDSPVGAPQMRCSCLVTPVTEPHELLQLQGFDDGHVEIRLYPSRRLVGEVKAPSPTTLITSVAAVKVRDTTSDLWLVILGGNFGHLHVYIMNVNEYVRMANEAIDNNNEDLMMTASAFHSNTADTPPGLLTLRTTLLAHQGSVRLVEVFPRESDGLNRQLFCSVGSDCCIALYTVNFTGTVKKLHSFEGHPADIARVRWDDVSKVLRVKCRYDPKEYVWDTTLSGQMLSVYPASHLADSQSKRRAERQLGANPFIITHDSMPDHYALLEQKAPKGRLRKRRSSGDSPSSTAAFAAAASARRSGSASGSFKNINFDDGHANSAAMDDSKIIVSKTKSSPSSARKRLSSNGAKNSRVKKSEQDQSPSLIQLVPAGMGAEGNGGEETAAHIGQHPKPLEGLVYATDQMLVSRLQLVRGLSVGCNLNPHVIFIHVKALMAETRAMKQKNKITQKRTSGDSIKPNKSYQSLREMVLNMLLSYDEANVVLEEQISLFPDKMQHRDEIAYALRGKASCITLLTPRLCSTRTRWCYSGALTALHNLTLTALLLEHAKQPTDSVIGVYQKEMPSISQAMCRLVNYYASTLPQQLRPHYQDAELAILAAIGMSSWKTGYSTSKLLMQTTVSSLPRLDRSNLAGRWAKKLHLFLVSVAELGMPENPVLIIDQATETEIDYLLLASGVEELLQREEIMVLVLSIFGIVNVHDLPPNITESIVGYLRKFLNCNRDTFLVFGAELLGTGFELWQPYIQNVEGLIQKLLILSVVKRTQVVTASDAVRGAAQKALIQIGTVKPGQFISIIEREVVREYSEARYHCTALMALVGVINTSPEAVHPYLLNIGDLLMAVLDPSESERRKSLIKVAIRCLRDMVLNLPMVRFHQSTQKLAIGARTGVVVIYDIKAGKRWDVLKNNNNTFSHDSAISCVAFWEDGSRLAFYNSRESCLQVWSIGEAAFGGFGSFLRSRRLV